jgi:hypothetical protein
MKPFDFAALLTTTIHPSELDVLTAGQREYANADHDGVFGNFDRLATLLGISRESVLLVYLMKHIDGITAYIRGHQSQREEVRGRIKDARAYLALLWGMVVDSEVDDDEGESIYLKATEQMKPGMVVERHADGSVSPSSKGDYIVVGTNGYDIQTIKLPNVAIGVCYKTAGDDGRAMIWIEDVGLAYLQVKGEIKENDFVKANEDGTVSRFTPDWSDGSSWLHFCGARNMSTVALPMDREHCDACGTHFTDSRRRSNNALTTPWKHTCPTLSTEIMVYTAVCPYCQSVITEIAHGEVDPGY